MQAAGWQLAFDVSNLKLQPAPSPALEHVLGHQGGSVQGIVQRALRKQLVVLTDTCFVSDRIEQMQRKGWSIAALKPPYNRAAYRDCPWGWKWEQDSGSFEWYSDFNCDVFEGFFEQYEHHGGPPQVGHTTPPQSLTYEHLFLPSTGGAHPASAQLVLICRPETF